MIRLSEERKQQIINEEPTELWLVLREEYSQDEPTADDLVCAEPDATSAMMWSPSFRAFSKGVVVIMVGCIRFL
ncbi:MAG TPA: hypothetical protein VIY49_30850 [Bryobacteraceae bacterium]